jgi:DnaJ like chaperone protein
MGANEVEGGIFQQVGSMFSSLFGGKLSTGQRLEVEVMFGLIGYLAKADGLITSYESEFTNKMMDQLKLTLDGRAEALAAYDRGRQAGFDPGPDIARFIAAHPAGSEEAERMFEVLLRLALSDGRIYAREREALEKVAAGFGITEQSLDMRLRAVKELK